MEEAAVDATRFDAYERARAWRESQPRLMPVAADRDAPSKESQLLRIALWLANGDRRALCMFVPRRVRAAGLPRLMGRRFVRCTGGDRTRTQAMRQRDPRCTFTEAVSLRRAPVPAERRLTIERDPEVIAARETAARVARMERALREAARGFDPRRVLNPRPDSAPIPDGPATVRYPEETESRCACGRVIPRGRFRHCPGCGVKLAKNIR